VKIVVAGGTGFIGEPLVESLSPAHDVAVLSRNPGKVRKGRGVQWDPLSGGPWQDELASADAVINLAGESIGDGRWTKERKRALLQSRLDATNAIASVLLSHPRPDRVLVNASAIGFYGSRGDDELDEQSSPGNDFLAGVVREWEAAARRAEPAARVVIVRFGIVLGPEGGALEKMLLPFKLFGGGPMGNGRQWMSWVDREDVLAIIRWAIENQSARGVYAAVAPHPVRNVEFARALGRALHRPSFMPAPAPALRLALGEMADGLLLSSQRVLPRRLTAEGYEFRSPELGPALERIVR
jgi:uncharacterized protein (TIGR01777 family)